MTQISVAFSVTCVCVCVSCIIAKYFLSHTPISVIILPISVV